SELRKIMIGKEYEETWENKTSNQTINDVNEQTLKYFFNSAISCGRMPKMEYDKRRLLELIGVMNKNYLTNAGVCLFSSKKPITLKMAVFATEHKETFLDMARIDGNIFQLIDEAVQYIIKNIRWRVEMNEDGIHRKEIPEVPLDAIREAVINSFAHARYDISVQHEVDIFSNRISICNPGAFANEFEPIDFYTRDIRSYLRNEVISKALYLCKDVESFGSGIRKIYTLCNDSNVSVSYINEETAFTLEFSRIDRNNMPLTGEINGGITDIELELISTLREHSRLTNSELAKILNKSQRTISRLLSNLKNKKLIERVGSNKTGYWKAI
ncbi:MAG: winged helix-turn-helix transcriptional regulator, partial [Candidatus Riflebacteria bacterium]|nr:winged helix-turn-helix transcriptional regulator [Candidatus Riflebacteria bacterium]